MPAKPCEPGCGCGLHSSLSVEERFWLKVERSGPISSLDGTHCWLWTSTTAGQGGYGSFKLDRRYRYAHRVSYELSTGSPVPDDRQIDHRATCPKICVNPAHLRLATQKQQQENLPGALRNSMTGVRGVIWERARGKYRATVGHNGRTIYVGRFDTIAEAEAAVIAKRNELFTHNDLDRMRIA